MMWFAVMFLNVEGRGPSGGTPPVEVERVGLTDAEKTEVEYTVAPHFGWTVEKQRIADEYDPQRASEKLNTILHYWNTYLRRALNDYFVETGDRDALCTRYQLLDRPCPEEHPLNVKLVNLLKAYGKSPDAWTYAEIVTTYDDIRRLVESIAQNKNGKKDIRKVKASYGLAPANVRIAKKPFTWDGGYTLLDGTNWISSAVAYTTAMEYNPTVVAVGGADTLVFAFNVDDCTAWCSGTTTNECVVVGHSYNRGQTMTLDFCIYSTAANLGEVAIGADPYRRTFTVAWTNDYYYPDIDIWAWTFHINNPLANNDGPHTVDFTSDITVTPYVNSEFNWGRPGCQGRWTSSCSCNALDNWIFVGYNVLGSGDADGDGYRDGAGVRIARSTTCGSSYSIVYDGPDRNGSAYDNNQIMLETTNDPRRSSSVCSSSNGGDNTIQAVYTWKNPASCSDPCSYNYITHLFTDASGGWGSSWTATDILSNYSRPISQPWLSVARTLDTSSMTHLVLFESRWSSSDGDIRGIHASGLPPSSWSSVFNVDFTIIDSRTPTVHTDARWQWCPGATTTTANYFHTAFYHKCPNTYDGRLCSEPYSSYNGTYRMAVMRAPWSSPETWGPEYCTINSTYADTIAIPPPPYFSGGGQWAGWWQLNGTTFRAHVSSGSAWWFGAFWVYRWSSSDFDLYWTMLRCLIGNGDDDLATGESKDVPATLNVGVEKGTLILTGEGRAEVYASDGRLIDRVDVKGKVSLPIRKGTYFVRTEAGVRRVVVR